MLILGWNNPNIKSYISNNLILVHYRVKLNWLKITINDTERKHERRGSHCRRQDVGHRVLSEGRLQGQLSQIVVVGGHVPSLAVPPQKVEAERSAEIEAQDFQHLDLHGADIAGGARVVGDVDEIAWKEATFVSRQFTMDVRCYFVCQAVDSEWHENLYDQESRVMNLRT